ncbi:MAG TPA: hypothetical protein VMB05_18535 [Solirubrobacteraceae bacterium]|nr:hypothetical protein [Solirubrobacteraceae bacterium]
MNPRRAAGLIGAGRAALGIAVLLAPEVTSSWLGEHARHPAVRYLTHLVGVRDLALGALTLAALRDGERAGRMQLVCAAADTVDVLATLAVRSELPAAGVAGTVALGGGAAAVGLYLARELA